MFNKLKKAVIKRRSWLRQVFVTSVAAGVAWFAGDRLIMDGGLVAAIICVLSIRVSLYKSVREGTGQIIGTGIGAGIALLTVDIFHNGFLVIGITVFMCAVIARAIRLGEVASVNVPVTALIVIGPGLSASTASRRFGSTVVGAVIAIGFSYFTHRKTPAGRTTDKIKSVARKSANLLALMSEGNAAGYTQHSAGHWLASARDLIEEIPALRSQSLEAKRYARWSPLQEADAADELYLRAVAIEHIVVQVRTIARTLFDMAVVDETDSHPNRAIAAALSHASEAITASTQILNPTNVQTATVAIANDLRMVCSNLAADLIAAAQKTDQDLLIKQISIVSNLERIADSIDESSPALSEVAMPDEPAMQKVMQVSPIDQTTKLSRRVWKAIRSFLRR
jgi:uncharacterized membrane protein YgaE (UPF0421/DUF939 family)